MHTLLKVTMSDVSTANAAVGDGRLQKIFQDVSRIISPESSMFYAEHGYRTALFIFDMKDASKIPQIAEPFFNELNARVEFFPAMDVKELSTGLAAWKDIENHASLS